MSVPVTVMPISRNGRLAGPFATDPSAILKRLPAGLALSLLYNKSSNFQPLAGRTDVLGNAIGNPSGATEDIEPPLVGPAH